MSAARHGLTVRCPIGVGRRAMPGRPALPSPRRRTLGLAATLGRLLRGLPCERPCRPGTHVCGGAGLDPDDAHCRRTVHGRHGLFPPVPIGAAAGTGPGPLIGPPPRLQRRAALPEHLR